MAEPRVAYNGSGPEGLPPGPLAILLFRLQPSWARERQAGATEAARGPFPLGDWPDSIVYSTF